MARPAPARPRRARGGLAAPALLLLAALAPAPAAAEAELRSDEAEFAALVREGIAHNMAGDFGEASLVWARLRAMRPRHPAPAALSVKTSFWRRLLDPVKAPHEASIRAGVARAKRLARARLGEEPDDAEAHFYLGMALTSEGRLEARQGAYYRGGTLGEEGRAHLERALALRPELVDAKYPLGLYAYYASLVPSVLQWLSFLWFVPSGEGERGLRYLETVRVEGELFPLEATYILSNIYTYFEPERRERAEELLNELRERFPGNRFLAFEQLELRLEEGRLEEAEALAREIETAPERHFWDEGYAVAARVWRARIALQRGDAGRAEALLEGVRPDAPGRPAWLGAWATLARGRIADLRGERERALARYAEVVALERPHYSRRAAERAEAGQASPFRAPAPEEPAARSASGDGAGAASAERGAR